MKNALCVGFGEIGCRHTQSLLGISPVLNIYVVEPNETIFKENEVRIGAKEEQLKHVSSIDEIDDQIDFTVIATSAFPRFEIMKQLLNKGVSKFLVEKVVFQSATQFKEIITLLEQKNAQAYCNFVNRYFDNYQEIKSRINEHSVVTMAVLGGEFGLACNALHYVDLFEFLTSKSASLTAHNLSKSNLGNRRGDHYKEVLGQLTWANDSGDSLSILSDENRKGGNEVVITFDNEVNILNEETLRHFRSGKDLIEDKAFELKYTSNLTKTIYEDITNNSIVLPTIQETESCHIQFFEVINETLGLAPNDICPIT